MFRFLVFIVFCSFPGISSGINEENLERQVTHSKSEISEVLTLNQTEINKSNKHCECKKLIVAGPISDGLESLLTHYSTLVSIDFSIGYIEDDEFRKICNHLLSLEQIDLSGSPITNKGLENLSNLTLLKELNLKDTFVNSDGLEAISKKVKVITS